MRRFLARQFARPTGLIGDRLIAPLLDRTGRAMSRVAFDQLEVRPGSRVLEVGFGGGVLSEMLLRAGAKLTGVDRSDAMVARADRRFSRAIAAGQANFMVGSAEDLPVERAFDAAVSVNTIYFWPDLAPVLDGFARAVRAGGQLVLCFQTPEAVRRWPGHRYGFTAHEPNEVRAAMAEAGFQPVATTEGDDARVGAFVSLKGERG